MHTDTQKDTQKHTDTHRHTNSTYRQTHKSTHGHTQTHTDTHTDTHKHTQTHTDAQRHTDRHTQRHTDAQRHTDTLRHTERHTHRYTNRYTQTHNSTRGHTKTHTDYTDGHTQTQTHRQTHTRPRAHPVLTGRERLPSSGHGRRSGPSSEWSEWSGRTGGREGAAGRRPGASSVRVLARSLLAFPVGRVPGRVGLGRAGPGARPFEPPGAGAPEARGSQGTHLPRRLPRPAAFARRPRRATASAGAFERGRSALGDSVRGDGWPRRRPCLRHSWESPRFRGRALQPPRLSSEGSKLLPSDAGRKLGASGV